MARRTLRLHNVVAPERDVIEIEHGGSTLALEIRTPDEIPPALAILIDYVTAALGQMIEDPDMTADFSDPLIESKIRRVVRGLVVDLPPEVEEAMTWRQRSEVVSFFGMRLAEARGGEAGNLREEKAKPATTKPTTTEENPSTSRSSSRGLSGSTEETPSAG